MLDIAGTASMERFLGRGGIAPITLDIDDESLSRRIETALEERPDLRASDLAEALVLVTDRATSSERGVPVVLLGRPARPGIFAASLDPELDPHLLLSAIRVVAGGFSIGTAPARVSRGFDADELHSHGARAPLSPREIQVLDLLVDGMSNKLVARRLGISVHTAKFHVAAVIDKLGASNRADAVAIAFRDGYLTL
jgi:DNA-binding CsgD family transcriptional regulator